MKTIFTLLTALLLAPLAVLQAAETKLPNVLLILADDLGASDLGCFGCTHYDTPNLDLLASRGVRLTNAYAASPSAPPRARASWSGSTPHAPASPPPASTSRK